MSCSNDDRLPATGTEGCCIGSAVYGESRCTCWIYVYDQTQQQPRPELPSSVMPAMCKACAYRPHSPERSGYAYAAADETALMDLVHLRKPFWCHDGLLAPVAMFHPPSLTWHLLSDDMAFHPPRQLDAYGTVTPYRVDGTPGDLCAGWTALVLKDMQRETVDV